jgi:cephalosporin-C deacetylase-like acetyl esterase
MFAAFCFILAILLYTRYKGPHNCKSYYEKTLKDKEYIMSKLVYYNRQNLDHQQKIRNNMITNLPDYSNHPEANLLHKTVYFS